MLCLLKPISTVCPLQLTANLLCVVTVMWMQHAVEQIFDKVEAAQDPDAEDAGDFDMDYFSMLKQVQM